MKSNKLLFRNAFIRSGELPVVLRILIANSGRLQLHSWVLESVFYPTSSTEFRASDSVLPSHISYREHSVGSSCSQQTQQQQ